jgi:hypothetical protein
MGATKKAKITFTCEPELKDGLEEWAIKESRTLSNLIEVLVRQAYENRTPPPPDNGEASQTQPPKAKRGKGKEG